MDVQASGGESVWHVGRASRPSFATLETELLDRHSIRSRDEARLAVFSYIERFYNPRRRHSTLGYQSPDRFEEEMMKPDTQTAAAVSS